KIGEPFANERRRAVEIRGGDGGGGFRPMAGQTEAWTDHALALAVGRAVIEALVETGQVASLRPIHGDQRAGGYSRLFLAEADSDEAGLFADSVAEVLGPLQQPRYVIERAVDRFEENWLSRLLPEVLARYVRKRRRHRCMVHAVPTALATHRDKAEAFERAWNRNVSPGRAIYTHRGAGRQLLDEALQKGLGPVATVHPKQIFQ
ncbi:MAG: hypothetical protein R3236_00915, partial [Phycisphaeraceae bacterium]|nr:hypothetical protein [Phycisphaeraceae bacterium]